MKKSRGYLGKIKCIMLTAMLVCSFTLFLPGNVKAAVTPTQPDYSLIFDAQYYYDKYEDVRKAFGKNPFLLFNHFVNNGMREGRQANKTFNVYNYASHNLDLIMRYGYGDLSLYYIHYITQGYQEGRSCEDVYQVSQHLPDKEEKPDYSGGKSAILTLVNQIRYDLQEGGIARTAELDAAADQRAKELVSVFSHNRPGGNYYTSIFSTYGVKSTESYEAISKGMSAESAFSSWMQNNDIAQAIQMDEYEYAGVGGYQDGDGVQYWVLILSYR